MTRMPRTSIVIPVTAETESDLLTFAVVPSAGWPLVPARKTLVTRPTTASATITPDATQTAGVDVSLRYSMYVCR